MGKVIELVDVANDPTRLHTVAKWPLNIHETRKLHTVKTVDVTCLLVSVGLISMICKVKSRRAKVTKGQVTWRLNTMPSAATIFKVLL